MSRYKPIPGEATRKQTRARVVEMAREWVERHPVFLDTETTGLGNSDRVCELSIIDVSGKPLFDSLLDPGIEIPEEAIEIHRITNEMVKGKPTLAGVGERVSNILRGKFICAYNTGFDSRLLLQTAREQNITQLFDVLSTNSTWIDVMKLSARYIQKKWNSRFSSWVWAPLGEVATFLNVSLDNMPIGRGEMHAAIYDTELTRRTLFALANCPKDGELPDVSDS